LGLCKLGTPQAHKNMTIIPIIVHDNKFIDYISIKEAEENGLIEIIESESVSQLQVVNKSKKQILIPFGMTVHGGKQDRTIWEPILLPIGGKQKLMKNNQEYTIPAKCIEQSRWQYKKGRGFKSSNLRIHPNVAYEAISPAGQGAVWNEIQSHRSEMRYASGIAPTQSYLEMTKNSEKETEKIVNNFKNVKNQCGIAVFINNEFIGMEFYANSDAWFSMSEDIYKAFSIEALRFKDVEYDKNDRIEYHDLIMKKLKELNLDFSARDGIGIGTVVEFKSEGARWRGITLVHGEKVAQFYLVSKRGGASEELPIQRNVQFQTVINQRYDQGYHL
jgi:hypothetical protein